MTRATTREMAIPLNCVAKPQIKMATKIKPTPGIAGTKAPNTPTIMTAINTQYKITRAMAIKI